MHPREASEWVRAGGPVGAGAGAHSVKRRIGAKQMRGQPGGACQCLLPAGGQRDGHTSHAHGSAQPLFLSPCLGPRHSRHVAQVMPAQRALMATVSPALPGRGSVGRRPWSRSGGRRQEGRRTRLTVASMRDGKGGRAVHGLRTNRRMGTGSCEHAAQRQHNHLHRLWQALNATQAPRPHPPCPRGGCLTSESTTTFLASSAPRKSSTLTSLCSFFL